VTNPASTGSPPIANTIGVVLAAARRQSRRLAAGRRDHCRRRACKFGGQPRQLLEAAFSPAIFDRDVLAFDIAGLGKALAECGNVMGGFGGRAGVEESGQRDRLLRPRRERAVRRRAGPEREESTPSDAGARGYRGRLMGRLADACHGCLHGQDIPCWRRKFAQASACLRFAARPNASMQAAKRRGQSKQAAAR
jgi:hypothetical protein